MGILITGGGFSPSADRFFGDLLPINPRIALYPQALFPRYCNSDQTMKAIRENGVFRHADISLIDPMDSETATSLTENYDALVIWGGNTFHLLAKVRETSFNQILEEVGNEIPVYGMSAGAIVMGCDIENASWPPNADENDINLRSLAGVDIALGYGVIAHFTEAWLELVHEQVRLKRRCFLALPDNAALYIDRSRNIITSVDGPAYMFSDHRVINTILTGDVIGPA